MWGTVETESGVTITMCVVYTASGTDNETGGSNGSVYDSMHWDLNDSDSTHYHLVIISAPTVCS